MHTLDIELEDIYFNISLSKSEAIVVMSVHRNVEETTTNYITTYYVVGMGNKSKKIMIKDVVNMSLRTILFTIARAFVELVLTMLLKHK